MEIIIYTIIVVIKYIVYYMAIRIYKNKVSEN